MTLALDFEKSTSGNKITHNLDYGAVRVKGKMLNERFDIRYNGLSLNSDLWTLAFDASWVPKTDRERLSLYFRDEITLNEQWTVVGDVRFDETSFDPQIND
ncbi:MAG: TonB-dependent receptor, partial [Gammaproteobacteria bacterium]|nr:TonB-dependent receptor [Gammaproteobacteria bacterium]